LLLKTRERCPKDVKCMGEMRAREEVNQQCKSELSRNPTWGLETFPTVARIMNNEQGQTYSIEISHQEGKMWSGRLDSSLGPSVHVMLVRDRIARFWTDIGNGERSWLFKLLKECRKPQADPKMRSMF
jgi:hypothetical protein